jgi:hypothetical protein
MSSAAQVLANQTNAALSTGPRTPEGRAISSQNALKFGLTSKQILLPFEDAAEFEAMETAIIEQVQPGNPAERLYADDIVVARWKVRRNELAQAAWVANELKKDTSADRNLAMAAISLSPEVRRFQRYASTDRRVAENAWKKVTLMQKERKEKEQRQAEARAIAQILKERSEDAAAKLRNEPNPAPEDAPKTAAAAANAPQGLRRFLRR